MDFEVSGLPLHILIVHATVIIVPLAALCVLLSAFSVKIRRKLGVITPILAAVALLLVPVTQAAGSWLYERVDTTTQISQHMGFGAMVLPWAVGLFLVALGQWILHRRAEKKTRNDPGLEEGNGSTAVPAKPKKNKLLAILGMALAVIVSVGSMFAIYQAGESGSRAVWENAYDKTK